MSVAPYSAPNLHCKPRHRLLVPEAAAAIGIDAKRVHRLIDDRLLPASAHTKVNNRRAIYAFALPMARFGAADGAKLAKRVRLAVMREIEGLVREHWDSFSKLDAKQHSLRYEDGSLHIDFEEAITAALEGLVKLLWAESKVVHDPDIRGGIPTVKGTRVGAYEAAGLAANDGLEAALECFPSLGRDDLEAALIYAKAHPPAGRPRSLRGSAPSNHMKNPVRHSRRDLRRLLSSSGQRRPMKFLIDEWKR